MHVPFNSVDDAIARRDGDGGQFYSFYDDLVAAHPGKTAVELAKLLLASLGVKESVQTRMVNGVKTRTRYGNDVQAIASHVREAGKRVGEVARPHSGARTRAVDVQKWAAQIGDRVRQDPAYLQALIEVLRRAGHLDT